MLSIDIFLIQNIYDPPTPLTYSQKLSAFTCCLSRRSCNANLASLLCQLRNFVDSFCRPHSNTVGSPFWITYGVS